MQAGADEVISEFAPDCVARFERLFHESGTQARCGA
jgi:hypothetical protein